MIELPEATASEVAKRALLGASWLVSIVNDRHASDAATTISDCLMSLGREASRAELGGDLGLLRSPAWNRGDIALVVHAAAGLDERFWRDIDRHRSRLERSGPTVLVLSGRAAEQMHLAAPHFTSWLAGAAWRLREESGLGRAEGRLAAPLIQMRPASGSGDFLENARWLREHRADFAGKWVALLAGEVVDSDSSRVALQQRLSPREDINRLLFVRVDE